MAEVTVVFADLTGSAGVFEALGNAKATHAITRLTDWIGTVCTAWRAHVVKNLGDGVLMVFTHSSDAIEAVSDMRRLHPERIKTRCGDAIVTLRRQACVLLVRGEVALGASFEDFTVPTVSFGFLP